MTTRVSLVIQSHLSDALYEMSFNLPGYNYQAQERLRFVKYLVHMFPDTNTKIDVDTVFQQFKLVEKIVAS